MLFALREASILKFSAAVLSSCVQILEYYAVQILLLLQVATFLLLCSPFPPAFPISEAPAFHSKLTESSPVGGKVEHTELLPFSSLSGAVKYFLDNVVPAIGSLPLR